MLFSWGWGVVIRWDFFVRIAFVRQFRRVGATWWNVFCKETFVCVCVSEMLVHHWQGREREHCWCTFTEKYAFIKKSVMHTNKMIEIENHFTEWKKPHASHPSTHNFFASFYHLKTSSWMALRERGKKTKHTQYSLLLKNVHVPQHNTNHFHSRC